MAPNLGAEVDGWEDGSGVYPDVMEDVGAEWSDEMKGMGFKIKDARDVAKEVPINEFFLWDPEFLAAVVDDGVLVWVAVDGKSTGRGGKEVGKDVG